MSHTALRAALVRARESARRNRLFDDPMAAEFLQQAGEPAREDVDRDVRSSAMSAALAFHVVIRTRFYDEYLTDAVAGGCRQVVLLAAGLDGRAFRLPWPTGVRLFEVDLPELLAFKEAAVARSGAVARCDRVVVATDLRAGWTQALMEAGLSPTTPTAWLAEGILVYLTAEDAARLLTGVTGLSAVGSRLAFERGDAALLNRRATVDGVTTLWAGGLGGDAEHQLTAHGWRATGHALASLAASYGRPTSRPAGSGFLTATLPEAGC